MYTSQILFETWIHSKISSMDSNAKILFQHYILRLLEDIITDKKEKKIFIYDHLYLILHHSIQRRELMLDIPIISHCYQFHY